MANQPLGRLTDLESTVALLSVVAWDDGTELRNPAADEQCGRRLKLLRARSY